jgi:hypothetical protein
MEITESLIQKFFDYKCTVEEADAVAAYFVSNPDKLAEYFEDEWVETGEVHLSAEEYWELLQGIQQKTDQKKNNLKWIWTVTAVAASLLLVIVMAEWLFVSRTRDDQYNRVSTKTAGISRWQTKMNTTDREMKILLEDGSVVRLQAGTVLKYSQLFSRLTTRDIYLSGSAFFKVAKDKTKPFTVYAGNIATTAVGTQFTVKEDNGKVTVKLYEGKVAVRAVIPLAGWKENKWYLLPGQELIYDQASVTLVVRTFPADSGVQAGEKHKTNGHTPHETINTVNWYQFNNQSLTRVFAQLEELYNVKIEYNEKEMKNVYFIGKFEKKDSVESILKNIALLKRLQLERKGNTYVFKRPG